VSAELQYVRSVAFTMANGTEVIDVLFLGTYMAGEPCVAAPEEVAAIRWMTCDEILAHDRTPMWLRESIRRVEACRLSCT
jgi:hypothetical protein